MEYAGRAIRERFREVGQSTMEFVNRFLACQPPEFRREQQRTRPATPLPPIDLPLPKLQGISKEPQSAR